MGCPPALRLLFVERLARFLVFGHTERSVAVQLPDEITQSAAKTHPTPTIWTAICENDSRFKWCVAAHRAMGAQNLVKWVQRIVGHAGYPVRIQHWERTGAARVLAEALLWDSGDELEDEFGHAQEMPAFSALMLGPDGQNYIEGTLPTSAFERGLSMLIEKPETVMLVLKSAFEAWESFRSPDELAMKRIEEGAAEAAANAVSNQLAKLLRQSGYRVDEAGDLCHPDDAGPESFASDEEEDETIDVDEEEDCSSLDENDETHQLERVEVTHDRRESLTLVAHQEEKAVS